MAQKSTKGRQKIELKKIDNEEDRFVTFSKRRSGIYKKASEISTLCGAQVGILIFSPSGKSFTYGMPNFEGVVDCFLGRNHTKPANDVVNNLFQAYKKGQLEETNNTHDELAAQLEVLKKRGAALAKAKRAIEDQCWWDAPIKDLNAHEMDHLSMSMENLNISATNREKELLQSQRT